MRSLLVSVDVDANPKTCGSCRFLRLLHGHVERPEEWWCGLFDVSRGLVGAQKTPNRVKDCLDAEAHEP